MLVCMHTSCARAVVAPLAATIIFAARAASAADCDIPALESRVAADTASVSARLELASAYYACGRYADAKILFDTVLRFENLPADLESQVEISAQAAKRYLELDDTGGRLVGFDYFEFGAGGYSVTSSSGTGSSEPSEAMYIVGLAGGLSYLYPSGYSLNGSFDYEGRVYDSSTTRNDSELNVRLGVSRSLGEANIEFALRGRMTYIGDSNHRYDYGASLGWNRSIDVHNEIALGLFVRRRDYPSGPLNDRSRSIAEANADWIHSFADGAASVSFGVHGGYQYATERADGDSAFYGASIGLNWPFAEHLSADVFALWENNRFNTDHVHFHPDTLDEAYILRREDNLYEIEAGLTWEFATTWALQPRVFYIHDSSNLDDFHYGSIEFWVTVRKSFVVD